VRIQATDQRNFLLPIADRADNVSSGSGGEPGFTSDKGASAEIVVSKAGEQADNEADGTRDSRTGLVS
jgi:hypothetical protein